VTTVSAQLIGDKALISRAELEQLIELARRSEPIRLQIYEDDLPTVGMVRPAESGGSFDFWREEGEDIYSAEDGEPL
jgi:hypothetical protein